MKRKILLITTLFLTSLTFSIGGESKIQLGISAGLPSAQGAVNGTVSKKFNPSKYSFINLGVGAELGGGAYIVPNLDVIKNINLGVRVIPHGFVNPYVFVEVGGSISNQTNLHTGISVGYIHTFGRDKIKISEPSKGYYNFPGLSTRVTIGGTNKHTGITGEFGVTAVFVPNKDNKLKLSLPNTKISLQIGKKFNF